jgi:hypothetical protein
MFEVSGTEFSEFKIEDADRQNDLTHSIEFHL